MSYERENLNDWRAALNHPARAAALRIGRAVARGLVLFGFCFVEIIAELLAPVVLIGGIAWSALPSLLSLASTEGQTHDLLNNVMQAVPRELHLGHTVVTPTGLIVDGLLLIGVVALCRTLQTIVATEG